jgi:uridylate kinase
MMATIMNALAITEAIRRAGTPAVLQSALHVAGIAPQFHRDKALTALEQGNVVILAGGTGHPFFTTDTTAALRARELDVEVILKATTVDGVYSADPKRVPDAVRYERLAFATALEKDLRVMDATAFSLCREGGVPILVFDFSRPDALSRVLAGTLRECTLVDDGPTVTAP